MCFEKTYMTYYVQCYILNDSKVTVHIIYYLNIRDTYTMLHTILWILRYVQSEHDASILKKLIYSKLHNQLQAISSSHNHKFKLYTMICNKCYLTSYIWL